MLPAKRMSAGSCHHAPSTLSLLQAAAARAQVVSQTRQGQNGQARERQEIEPKVSSQAQRAALPLLPVQPQQGSNANVPQDPNAPRESLGLLLHYADHRQQPCVKFVTPGSPACRAGELEMHHFQENVRPIIYHTVAERATYLGHFSTTLDTYDLYIYVVQGSLTKSSVLAGIRQGDALVSIHDRDVAGLPLGEVCDLLAGLYTDSLVLGIGTFGPLNGSVTDSRRVEIRLGRRSPLPLPESSSRSHPDSHQHGVAARDGPKDEYVCSSAATDVSQVLRATTLPGGGVSGACETTGVNGTEEVVENGFGHTPTSFGRDSQESPQSIDLQGSGAHQTTKLAVM